MKKKVAAFLAGTMVLTSAVCFATVPEDSIALADVAPGSSVEAAKEKLGTPSYRGDKLYFSNGVIIEADDYRPNTVEEVSTTTAHAAATPGGIQVGMAESVITEIYGTPDKLDQDYDDTEYIYYSQDNSKKLVFKAVNGTIVKIKCELR